MAGEPNQETNHNAALELDDALRLLEIDDLQTLEEKDLRRIRKRAFRRWHPDKIAHTNPDPELVDEYEKNFKNIEPALELVEAFLSGDMGAALNRKGERREEEIKPEEAVRKYGSENQDSVRQLWPEVKKSDFELDKEDVVLTEGITIQEALNEDLKDKVPGSAVFSLGVGILIMLLASIVVIVIGIFSETIGTILLYIVMGGWFIHAGSCLLFMLPLSRFWLPAPLTDGIISIVNVTLDVSSGWVHDEEGFGRFAHGALSVVAAFVHWVIALPLYKLAGILFKDKRIGRNVVSIEYYAGFAAEYVDLLLSKKTTEMSLEELMDVSNMASRFRHVRGHAA